MVTSLVSELTTCFVRTPANRRAKLVGTVQAAFDAALIGLDLVAQHNGSAYAASVAKASLNRTEELLQKALAEFGEYPDSARGGES